MSWSVNYVSGIIVMHTVGSAYCWAVIG